MSQTNNINQSRANNNAHEESGAAIVVDHYSSGSEFLERPSFNEFQTAQHHHNNLELSISLVERTAKKLVPIYKELLRRLVPTKNVN